MWQDDSSGLVKPVPDSAEFIVEGKPSGSPVNALYSQPLSSGQYFEIDVLELQENVGIGVTTQEAFGPGWGCKGLFFNGNLSNGSALVRSSFGEQIKKGMQVGVLTEFDSETVSVVFYQDGRCLGPAFISKRLSGAEIFPVVHTSHEGDRFGIRLLESAPSVRTRQPKGGGTLHPAEGVWTLKQIFVGPELVQFPLTAKMGEGSEVTLKVEAIDAGSFHFSARVVNKLNFSVVVAPDDALAPFEKLTPGLVMATKMMGPPGMMEVEKEVASGFEALFKWLARDGKLTLTGPTVEMSFVPQVGGTEALPAIEIELP